MPRGVAAVVAFLLLAAPVGAQTPPPDERAAARAFVDATHRFLTAIDAVESRFEPAREHERMCAYRARRQLPEHRWDEVNLLGSVADDRRPFAQLVSPPFMQFAMDLHAVATADPALRGGRTAVRRVRRTYAAIAALPPYNVCAEIERWVDGGFRPTPVLRRVQHAIENLDQVTAGDDVQRRMCRMGLRLRELGIPESEAAIFYDDEPCAD